MCFRISIFIHYFITFIYRPPPVAVNVGSGSGINSGASSGGGGGGLFSQIRGGAGSFLKNLKDTSTKVVQSVQQYVINLLNNSVL